MAKFWWRLLPHDKMRVDAGSYSIADDARRFLVLFRNTWRKIPLGDKRVILGWFREAPCPSPAIRVSNDPYDVDLSRRYAGKPLEALAQCDPLLRQLRFWLPYLFALPERLAESFIAHELAHVYCLARQEDWHSIPMCEVAEDLTGAVTEWREQEADSRAEDWWGFPVGEFNTYQAEHYDELITDPQYAPLDPETRAAFEVLRKRRRA